MLLILLFCVAYGWVVDDVWACAVTELVIGVDI